MGLLREGGTPRIYGDGAPDARLRLRRRRRAGDARRARARAAASSTSAPASRRRCSSSTTPIQRVDRRRARRRARAGAARRAAAQRARRLARRARARLAARAARSTTGSPRRGAWIAKEQTGARRESIRPCSTPSRSPTRFPWRTSTLVVGAIAARRARRADRDRRDAPRAAARARAAAAAAKPPQTGASPNVRHVARVPSHPLRPRARVSVLVLNGNGVRAPPRATAARLEHVGYRIGGADERAATRLRAVDGDVRARLGEGGAPARARHRRPARRAGRRPAPAQLKGSKVVLILGS